MSTKTKDEKSIIIRIRATKEEKLLWQARANHFCGGNLSKYLRASANNYRTKNRKS